MQYKVEPSAAVESTLRRRDPNTSAIAMIELLPRLLASLMNQVRVNKVGRAIDNGIPVFVKRRRLGGSFVIWLGNQFLRLASSGSRMFVRPSEWLEWELHCWRLLYPERVEAKRGPGRSVIVPEIRGRSLRHLLDRRERVDAAFGAAARELRRVHQLSCQYYQACWSHGDLHLDNILYDADADRAFLIDFDTRHELSRDQTQRHSDDLRVILLELIAADDEIWVQPATAFLEEYREPSVLADLAEQLFVPGGFARLLWFTRTNSDSLQRIEPRIKVLREIVQTVASIGGNVSSTQRFDPSATESNRESRTARNRS